VNLEIAKIDSYLKERLPEKYQQRSYAVADLMVIVAGKYGLNPYEAKLAGLLHLIARQLREKEMIAYLNSREIRLMSRLPAEYKRVSYLTGPASAWLALEELDQRLNSLFRGIREHTLLFKKTTMLAQCLFISTVLIDKPNEDIRAAVLMREFLAGRGYKVLRELNKREISTLNKTNIHRIARISNPDIDDVS